MSTVKVHTAQNVSIDYKIASVGDRILATIVDGLIVFGIYVLFFMLTALIPDASQYTAVLVIIFIVPAMFYHLVCEVTMDGQSFGKKALRTKVVKLDGSSPTLGSYLLRWLIRFVEVSMSYGGIALIAVIANGKGQRLGDMAAGTCVIKLQPTAAIGDTIFRAVDETYEVAYPEVTRLTDEDASIIHDVIVATNQIGRSREMNRLAEKTKTIVAEKIGVQPTEEPRAFLRRVLRDYNHLAGRLID